MPRPAKPQDRVIADQTLVVDNGGYTIKAGFAGDSAATHSCKTIPNCIAKDRGKRIWVGSQLENCTDFGEIAFRRPIEKGYLVNWEAEKAIWDNMLIEHGAPLKVRISNLWQLSTHKKQCDPHDTNLILTESPNTPAALQMNCDQIIFEEYDFSSYSRCVGL